MRRRLRRLVAVGGALILGAGCRTVSDKGAMHGLPPPPPGPTSFSDYQPDHPYEPSGKGVAERSMYSTASPEGYDVVVRDFLVSPIQAKAELAIAGAAVLEVRQGSGEATVGEREIDLQPGTVFTIGDGESLWLSARGEPLALRAWIVSPRGEP